MEMQSPAVIRQAHRTLHMPAKTPLTGDNMDAPAACAVPFCPYCGGVVTRTRNVSEYMLVLALCLFAFIEQPTEHNCNLRENTLSYINVRSQEL